MINLNPVVFKWEQLIHWSLSKSFNVKYKGVVVWPGNPINGAVIFRETSTRRTASGAGGKTSTCYYLAGEKTPILNDWNKFVRYYTVNKPQTQSEDE